MAREAGDIFLAMYLKYVSQCEWQSSVTTLLCMMLSQMGK